MQIIKSIQNTNTICTTTSNQRNKKYSNQTNDMMICTTSLMVNTCSILYDTSLFVTLCFGVSFFLFANCKLSRKLCDAKNIAKLFRLLQFHSNKLVLTIMFVSSTNLVSKTASSTSPSSSLSSSSSPR